MKKTMRLVSIILVLTLVFGVLAACGGQDTTDPLLKDVVSRSDYTSVYDKIGAGVTIDKVVEDENGVAWYTHTDGIKYELGMDFLSMAMVYNCQVPANSEKYLDAEDVYNEWWKLYIQRWNMLVPEVPLYSNQYFDLYNAKIEGFETTPYWGPADAIIASTIKSGEESKVILGSATELSGAFRNASWGKSSPGSSDLDIQELTSGYATVQTDKTGAMVWNMSALASEPTSEINSDGTLTYTITIKEGLKFSDGSAINAKNYVAGLLANSTVVGQAAGGSGTSGQLLKGFEEFKAYEGEGEQVYFEGVKLLSDYSFSVTFLAEYANYYYAQSYASYGPDPLTLYVPQGEIVVDSETKAVGLSADFYKKVTKEGAQVYEAADKIIANLKWDSDLPYSGPYVVSNYDASKQAATLTLNSNYPGDDARGVASIETIAYVKVISETQMDQFKKGEVDVIAGITGAAETEAALAAVKAEPDKYAETHYDRAGYGKLGFRCDFGPTAFASVRQAIMYTLNRNSFAQTFTGGYGSVVHGPYYTGSAAYLAVKDEIKLNTYAVSSANAIAVLEADGWIYNAEGGEYTSGIRYKKLEGYEKTYENLKFATTDNAYKTVKVGDDYYMPLAINWFGTQPNDVTDQLMTQWQDSTLATKAIGMYITYTSSDFNTALYGELYRIPDYGYTGTPRLNAVNFATGFNSAIYDFAFNWTIDPEVYDNYSTAFLMDAADFWADYQPAA